MQVLLCLICVLELKELVHVKKSQYHLAGAANPSNAICSIMWPDCLNVSVIWGGFVPVHLKRTQMQTQRQAGCTTRASFGDELTSYKIQNTKCKMQNAYNKRQTKETLGGKLKNTKLKTKQKPLRTEWEGGGRTRTGGTGAVRQETQTNQPRVKENGVSNPALPSSLLLSAQ